MEPGALEFLERIAIPPGAEILDVGCGEVVAVRA
jgi:2-polyprenyl-3-methyl-5-hydroxy-6-metoxy-1,4-benzoquinol methylase